MARCACGNAACSCIVKAKTNGGVVVTGSGSPERPYELSLVTGGNPLDALQMIDTATLKWTSAGAGTPQDKRRLTGVAEVSMQELTDVSKTDVPVTGDVVQWNGTQWVFAAPGATSVPVSGTWGTPPLAIYGSDSTIGKNIYLDSNGQIRSAPLTLPVDTFTAAAPISGYPLGPTVMTLSNASAASGLWPLSASATVTTHHRYDAGGSTFGWQEWVRTGANPMQLIRYSNGGTWSPWFYAGGQAPHYSAAKPSSQALTTANTSYTITYDSVVTNEGGITYAGGIFTVPIAGKYLVDINQHVQVTGSPTLTSYLLLNGAGIQLQSYGGVGGNRNILTTKVVKCAAGDQLNWQLRSSLTGAVAYGASSRYSTVDITLIGG